MNAEFMPKVRSYYLIYEESKAWQTAAKNNWQLLQEVPIPLAELHLKAEKPYGFLDMHSGYFKNVSYADNQVNELGPDAENVAAPDRRKLRLDHEDEKWDEEHYMWVFWRSCLSLIDFPP